MAVENFIIIGLEPWNGTCRRSRPIVIRLAQRGRALYLDPPVSIASWRKFFGNLFRILNYAKEIKDDTTNVYMFPTVAMLPFGRLPIIKKINARFTMLFIKKIQKRLQLEHPILWIWDFWEGQAFIGKLDERLVVYDCYDAYDGYPKNEKNAAKIENIERSVAARCDITFAVSDKLLRRVSQWTNQAYRLPNAVDWENYNRVQKPAQGPPKDIAYISHPIIGYMGGNKFDLDNKVDFELISSLAKRNPSWSFVFLGPYENLESREDIRSAARFENVHFLGGKRTDEVPLYIKQFDACIIPWKHSRFAEYANPIKLYEYLACGAPIVSTQLPDIVDFDKRHPAVVKIAGSTDEFETRLNEAIRENNVSLVDKRRALAQQNSWDSRVEEIFHKIDERIAAIYSGNKKRVTILIPTRFDSRYMLELCLETIKKYTEYPYKIIVGDAGVNKETREFLEKRTDIRLVEADNPSLPKDSMIKYVDTRYFLFLHDDTQILKKGWLAKRVVLMEKDPRNAVVGPVVANFVYGWKKRFLYKRSMRRFWPLVLLVKTNIQQELGLRWGAMGEKYDTGGMVYAQFMRQRWHRAIPCKFHHEVKHFGSMTWPVKKKVQNEKTGLNLDYHVKMRNKRLDSIKQILVTQSY